MTPTDKSLILPLSIFKSTKTNSFSNAVISGIGNEGFDLYEWLKDKISPKTYFATEETNSTTTLKDIPNLTTKIEAGKRYEFKSYIVWESAANTTGIGLCVMSPTNTYWTVNSHNGGSALTAASPSSGSYFNGGASIVIVSPGGQNPDTDGKLASLITGEIFCTTSGNLKLQFASEISSSEIKVLSNSFLSIKEII